MSIIRVQKILSMCKLMRLPYQYNMTCGLKKIAELVKYLEHSLVLYLASLNNSKCNWPWVGFHDIPN